MRCADYFVTPMFLLASCVDIVYIVLIASVPLNVFIPFLIIFVSLFFVCLICLYFRIVNSWLYAAHFCFGYSILLLICISHYPIPDRRSSVPLISLILLVCAAFLSVSIQHPTSYHRLANICMWLGFSCCSFQHVTPLIPIRINLVLLVHWIVLHQQSYWSFLLLFIEACVLTLYTVPSQLFTPSIRSVSDVNASLYLSICFPLLFVYIIYLMRFHWFGLLRSHPNLILRWSKFINAPSLMRSVIGFVIGLTQVSALVQSLLCLSISITGLWRIFVFIPLLLAWCVSHVSSHFIVSHWNRKLSYCNRTCQKRGELQRDLLRVWMAHGFRNMALIAETVHLSTVLSTLFLTLCVVFLYMGDSGLFELCLPIEVCFYSLFRELNRTLGGTCVGYAIVTQPLSNTSLSAFNDSTTTGSHQLRNEFAERLSSILKSLQTFFHEFFIHDYGKVVAVAEGSAFSSNPSEVPVLGKSRLMYNILNFFRHRESTMDIRFDTYLLYYCGPTNDKGDWILEDGSCIDLESLLDTWRLTTEEFGTQPQHCRLLLMVDCLNAGVWYTKLLSWKTQHAVALQTAEIPAQLPPKPSGLLSALRVRLSPPTSYVQLRQLNTVRQLGKFTDYWVSWNVSQHRAHLLADYRMQDFEPPVCHTEDEVVNSTSSLISSENRFDNFSSVYVTTGHWLTQTRANFTARELRSFWHEVFPSPLQWLLIFFHPLLVVKVQSDASIFQRISKFPVISFAFSIVNMCTTTVWRFYRHWIFPRLRPAELDTGHGFYLLDKRF
ncbi:hypothetical protein PHET_03943 [Paragonimus heterotremus]|uniref:Transmembrane protein 168 n=1 Tax=Paragonimus heterotremus TaxID=100268 RepID=A0A8J4WJK1_9TREM|nr:hypothetical protein PHET_03943 [Paragonimus heterotremus]